MFPILDTNLCLSQCDTCDLISPKACPERALMSAEEIVTLQTVKKRAQKLKAAIYRNKAK